MRGVIEQRAIGRQDRRARGELSGNLKPRRMVRYGGQSSCGGRDPQNPWQSRGLGGSVPLAVGQDYDDRVFVGGIILVGVIGLMPVLLASRFRSQPPGLLNEDNPGHRAKGRSHCGQKGQAEHPA